MCILPGIPVSETSKAKQLDAACLLWLWLEPLRKGTLVSCESAGLHPVALLARIRCWMCMLPGIPASQASGS